MRNLSLSVIVVFLVFALTALSISPAYADFCSGSGCSYSSYGYSYPYSNYSYSYPYMNYNYGGYGYPYMNYGYSYPYSNYGYDYGYGGYGYPYSDNYSYGYDYGYPYYGNYGNSLFGGLFGFNLGDILNLFGHNRDDHHRDYR